MHLCDALVTGIVGCIPSWMWKKKHQDVLDAALRSTHHSTHAHLISIGIFQYTPTNTSHGSGWHGHMVLKGRRLSFTNRGCWSPRHHCGRVHGTVVPIRFGDPISAKTMEEKTLIGHKDLVACPKRCLNNQASGKWLEPEIVSFQPRDTLPAPPKAHRPTSRWA